MRNFSKAVILHCLIEVTRRKISSQSARTSLQRSPCFLGRAPPASRSASAAPAWPGRRGSSAYLAADLDQPVLLHQLRHAERQFERLPRLVSFDVFDMWRRPDRRLAQSGWPGRLALVVAFKQIGAAARCDCQCLARGFAGAPIGTDDGLGADALNDIGRTI